MTTKNKSYFNELEKTFGRLTFGEMLKSLREVEGKTQAQFSKKLGFSVQNLCDIEKGRRIPSPVRAASIAKKLKLPMKAMIEFSLRDALESEGLKYNVSLEEPA
jgi:transcriptional regulator with XRE-family HTH domain